MTIPERLGAALADRYELVRELGEGGMAFVYLARDLKHNRDVAIKVLKSDLAAVVGEERFLGEIETTAQLQHPNILPLFDSGAVDGFLFYAMPYVEGETLRDRLNREAQLPVEDALDLTQKVASALDYAHEKGVVHRDIKPANILLSSGEPLVADFGIALAVSQANDGRRTETGLSLGTPHYMSPEQAAGDRSLDPRSDVYALGCILQEMLTGEPPFSGANAQAVLARILTSTPTRVTSLRPTVPPHVEGVIAKALEKLPADRFKTAKDFRKGLSDTDFRHVMTEHTMGTASVPTMPAPTVRRGAPLAVVAGLAGVAAVALVAASVGWLRPAPEEPVRRFALDLDVGSRGGIDFGVSPQGDRFAYVGRDGGIFVRNFDSLEDQQIPGSSQARGIEWSPDGSSLAFNAPGSNGDVVFTAAVSGGSPIPVSGTEDTYPDLAWADDGFVYYVLDTNGPDALARAPAQGGPAERIETDTDVLTVHAIPGAPDRVLVTIPGQPVSSAIVDVTSGEVRPIAGMNATAEPRYLDGYLFWIATENGSLAAARFDLDREELTSVPVTLGLGLGPGDYDVSEAGVVIYRSSAAGVDGPVGESLGWVDREGTLEIVDERLGADVGDFDDFRLDPNGRFVAYEMERAGNDGVGVAQRIQIYDLEQGTSYQLTFEGNENIAPRWLPDGRVAYLSDQDGEWQIYAQPYDRSGTPEILVAAPGPPLEIVEFEVGPEPGAPLMLTVVDTEVENSGLYLADPDALESALRPFVNTPFDELNPAISPDGRWVAYTSNESDRDEVYVRRFPEGGRPFPVSDEQSSRPLWSPEGDEILYVTPNRVVARALDVGDEVLVAGREELFAWAGLYEFENIRRRAFDIGQDGRLLVIAERSAQRSAGTPDGPRPHVILIFNVLREIEERLAQSEAGR